jgi:hypothetical protein
MHISCELQLSSTRHPELSDWLAPTRYREVVLTSFRLRFEDMNVREADRDFLVRDYSEDLQVVRSEGS